jgi:acetyltransferase-like isoleucine patch superfamily enzyme
MTRPRFYPLLPGVAIPGDWHAGVTPTNIEVGEGTVIDSTACFQHYKAAGACGLRVGKSTTIWRTTLAPEVGGVIEIGDWCHLAEAALTCMERITLGDEVIIASGVTIVDSDFHPFEFDDRVIDAVAISPLGSRNDRPAFGASPVEIGNGVRIGANATILKGVHVGHRAVIAPGAVVIRDVTSCSYVMGNPAREVDLEEES